MKPLRLAAAGIAVAVAGAALFGLLRDPLSADHQGSFIDEEIDCLEAVPAHLSLASSPTSTVKVRVLLDGVTTAQRDTVVSQANASFAARGVRLDVVGTDSVSLSGTDARGLIDQARTHYGGARPSGSHAVLVLSGKDLTGPAGPATAGLADCIGGARFARHAFAVAEIRSASKGGIIATHEVAHLLGAHHHYASCVERGGSSVSLHVGVPPCTLMINDVNLARPDMSQVTGRVVRGHAERL